ncbi:hypothetical protein BDF22DRAFT_742458 [Syncephalis plumigaleata]|nr:hypothetical protein BDF22DRAFT_742458 [Syncephalis plumigaleata]
MNRFNNHNNNTNNGDEQHLRQQLQQLQLQVRTLEAQLQNYGESKEKTRHDPSRHYAHHPSSQRHLLDKPLEDSELYGNPQRQQPYLSESEYRPPSKHPFFDINIYSNGKQAATMDKDEEEDEEDEVEGEWWRSDMADVHWTRQSMTPLISDDGEEILPSKHQAQPSRIMNNNNNNNYNNMYRNQDASSTIDDNASSYSYGVERVLTWMDNALDVYHQRQKQRDVNYNMLSEFEEETRRVDHRNPSNRYAFTDTTLASNRRHRQPTTTSATAAATRLPEVRVDPYGINGTNQTHRVHKSRKLQTKEREYGMMPMVDSLPHSQTLNLRKSLPNPYEMLGYQPSNQMPYDTRRNQYQYQYREQDHYKQTRI